MAVSHSPLVATSCPRLTETEVVPTQFVTGGACPHLICLTADVDAFKGFWGDDASEIVSYIESHKVHQLTV
jgi:hypothetical protein